MKKRVKPKKNWNPVQLDDDAYDILDEYRRSVNPKGVKEASFSDAIRVKFKKKRSKKTS